MVFLFPVAKQWTAENKRYTVTNLGHVRLQLPRKDEYIIIVTIIALYQAVPGCVKTYSRVNGADHSQTRIGSVVIHFISICYHRIH